MAPYVVAQTVIHRPAIKQDPDDDDEEASQQLQVIPSVRDSTLPMPDSVDKGKVPFDVALVGPLVKSFASLAKNVGEEVAALSSAVGNRVENKKDKKLDSKAKRDSNLLGPEAVAFMAHHPGITPFVARKPEALEWFMKHPTVIKRILDHPEILQHLLDNTDEYGWLMPPSAAATASREVEHTVDVVEEKTLGKRSVDEEKMRLVEQQDTMMSLVPSVAPFRGLGGSVQLRPRSVVHGVDDHGIVEGLPNDRAGGIVALVFIAVIICVVVCMCLRSSEGGNGQKKERKPLLPVGEKV